MSLEASLDAATAAMKDLTAALIAAKGPTDKPAKAAKTAEPAAPTVTKDQVTAAAVAIKAKFGQDVAKEMIKTHGKAAELKAMKPEAFAAFVEACNAKMTEEPEEATEEDDGL